MPERRTRRLKPSVQVDTEVARPGQPSRKVRCLSRIVSSILSFWYQWRRRWHHGTDSGGAPDEPRV